jgi:hypothetical protein
MGSAHSIKYYELNQSSMELTSGFFDLEYPDISHM